MLGHHIGMTQKFLSEQPSRQARSRKDAQHPQAAEKMQRPGKIAQQKANGNQVEKHSKGAGNAVVRSAMLAVRIADGNLADGSPVPRR